MPDDIRRALADAHAGRFVVRVRAVNPSGNTIDVEGYVTAMREDGGIRLSSGDPAGGQIHDFAARTILAVHRVHGG